MTHSPSAPTENIKSTLGETEYRAFVVHKDLLSSLSLFLRLLPAAQRDAPCGLLGAGGAEELLHKDALSSSSTNSQEQVL